MEFKVNPTRPYRMPNIIGYKIVTEGHGATVFENLPQFEKIPRNLNTWVITENQLRVYNQTFLNKKSLS
jgi:hypothetical protein